MANADNRCLQYAYGTPIAVRKLCDEQGQPWLDTDLEYTVPFHVFVPPGRYDLVCSQIVPYYAKRNDRKSVTARWGVGEKGAIYAIPCEKQAGFEKNPRKCNDIDGSTPEGAKLWDHYELGEIDSVAEVSLLEPTARQRSGDRAGK